MPKLLIAIIIQEMNCNSQFLVRPLLREAVQKRREGLKKDTKIFLLRGGGGESKQIMTFSSFLDGFPKSNSG